MTDIIRVLRVYEFVGPREKVERQVAASVHGQINVLAGGGRGVSSDHVIIRAATIGTYPEILKQDDPALALRRLHEEAQKYFPDDDSKREGYLEALADVITKLERKEL